MTVAAEGHEFIGVTMLSDDAEWFVHSAGPDEWVDRPWPSLPSEIDRARAGFSATRTKNVFATTEVSADAPREWDRVTEHRVVLRTRAPSSTP